jgi:hypothetical protein
VKPSGFPSALHQCWPLPLASCSFAITWSSEKLPGF